jgi:hypothetical protein
VDENYIIFITQGDEASLNVHMKFQVDPKTWEDNSCLKMDCYALKYLTLITKATSLSAYVTLYLAKSFVLAVRYSIGTIGEITFCLAPQIDESEYTPPPIISLSNIFKDDARMLENMESEMNADASAAEVSVEGSSEDAENIELPEDVVVVEEEGYSKDVVGTKRKGGMVLVDKGEKLKRKRRKKKRKDVSTDNMIKISEYTKQQKDNKEMKGHLMSGSHLPSEKMNVNDILLTMPEMDHSV